MSASLSVIMPAYNGERYIAAALDSVQQQLPIDAELLVIDDGSTDRTLEVVRSYAQSLPIRVIRPERTGNWVAATNIMLREAQGEWACFLHQDDLWLPHRIERLLPAMGTAPGTLVLHNSIFVDANGAVRGPWTCPLAAGDVSPDEWTEHLLVQNFVAIPAPVFRRAAAIESGGLDEALWFSADWDLWLRLGALAPVRFLPETLAAFRIHSSSQTANRKLSEGEWENQLNVVLDRHLSRWHVSRVRAGGVIKAAHFSIALNSALAAASRGEPVRVLPILRQLLALGPVGWRRYLRDSRILQRVRSRWRVLGRSSTTLVRRSQADVHRRSPIQ